MNSTEMTFGTQNAMKAMKKLDEVNKSSMTGTKIEANQVLLVTLSTTIMLAKKQLLPKEHYQWTRIYLKNVRDEDGSKLPCIQGLIEEIDSVEKKSQIVDELQKDDSSEVPSVETLNSEEDKEDKEERSFQLQDESILNFTSSSASNLSNEATNEGGEAEKPHQEN